jgi:hypothetical protein
MSWEMTLGGLFSLAIGFFMLVYGPGDRLQLKEWGRMARLIGLGFIALGILLIKW